MKLEHFRDKFRKCENIRTLDSWMRKMGTDCHVEIDIYGIYMFSLTSPNTTHPFIHIHPPVTNYEPLHAYRLHPILTPFFHPHIKSSVKYTTPATSPSNLNHTKPVS